jgi:hypothetical protein
MQSDPVPVDMRLAEAKMAIHMTVTMTLRWTEYRTSRDIAVATRRGD